ncbi:MAG: hypothetical protein ACQETH_15650 [Candidatus Rifleibacteriota bacterium]
MQLKNVLFLTLLVFVSARLFAVSPDASLPQWYKADFFVSEWLPEQKSLIIQVDIEAKEADLHNVSCRLYQDFSKIQNGQVRNRKIIQAGDKASFLFRFQVEPPLDTWFDCDLRAMPDPRGLTRAVEKENNDALTHKVKMDQIKAIKEPIKIGTTFPVFVRDDIAQTTTAQLAFRPEIKHCGRDLYLWLPENSVGKGITGETLKALKKSTKSLKFKSAVAACDLLIRKFSNRTEPVVIQTGPQETFEIPVKVAIQLIEGNRITLKALRDKNIQVMKNTIDNMEPKFYRPYVCFNLAQFLLVHDFKEEAAKWLEIALNDIPSWSKAEELLENSD